MRIRGVWTCPGEQMARIRGSDSSTQAALKSVVFRYRTDDRCCFAIAEVHSKALRLKGGYCPVPPEPMVKSH